MGVKDFTKVFEPLREIKYKNLAGKTVAIDGNIEIYRAALGMSGSFQLTDKAGNPSSHINIVLLGVILKLKAAGADQYWVFDYESKEDEYICHNPLKE
jgi:XPG N-terminal domain